MEAKTIDNGGTGRSYTTRAFLPPPLCEESDENKVCVGEAVFVFLKSGGKIKGKLHQIPKSMGDLQLTVEGHDEPHLIDLSKVKLIQLPKFRRWISLSDSSGGTLIESPEPQAFEIRFCDGDEIKGKTMGFNTDQHGLYLYPTQKKDTFFYGFLPHQAIDHSQIGPKIGQQLLKDNVVSEDHLQSALSEQEDLRARPIGEYLLRNAVVTSQELEQALLNQQRMPNIRLGELLLQENLITEEQLEAALEAQKTERSQPLGEILIEDGKITPEQLQKSLAKKLGIPFVDLDKFELDETVLLRIKEKVARQHTVMPLCMYHNKIVVALNNPLEWKVLEAVRFAADMEAIPVMAPVDKIKQTIDRYYTTGVLDDPDLEEEISDNDSFGDDQEEEIDESAESNNLVIRLANKIVYDAYHAEASDIHIEPYPAPRKTKVRFRKDGSLIVYREIPAGLRRALIARFKIMAKLNIAEKRVPQDGKINFGEYARLKIELRIATIPTARGEEDIVIRLLSAAAAKPMTDLLLSNGNMAHIQRALSNPHGLFFVCGPTGSGKTTTLHSLLGHLNTPDRKIWTAEDPVEITQEGLRQVQVQANIGLSFVSVLRSFLRADPDIIMVGEMRDEETTRIGIEASLTGHLVLSTLHTNSAVESVVRLLEIGMDPFNFADALLGVLAQRLAKKLCSECRESFYPGDEEIRLLLNEYCYDFNAGNEKLPSGSNDEILQKWRREYGNEEGQFILFRSTGCDACNNTGYTGRIALHEVMMNSERIRQAIYQRATASELMRISLEEGMHTLRQDGIEKVLQGHTDIHQVRKVCAH